MPLKKEKKGIDFENASIGKLLISLSIPAITAQIVNALYNIVDRIYLGNMANDGALALTGVGLCFPILILISAFAVMIGVGGAPLLSMKLGEGDKKTAEEVIGNCFSVILFLGVLLTVVFFVLKEPLLYMFGASEKTFSFANDYLSIYLIGTIFVQIGLGMNMFINAQGYAKTGMLTVLIGAITNIILDPLFIFTFNMGVKGAATATVISQIISATWVLLFLFGKKPLVKIHRANLKLVTPHLKRVLSLGASPFVMQSTESLLQIILNKTLSSYGGDVYVGAMTIISSIAQFVLMPLIGIMQGAQPIISFNYGAKRMERVKKAIKLSVITCTIISGVCWLIVQLQPQLVIGLFTSSKELTEVTVRAIRVYMFGYIGLGVIVSLQQSFLSLGEAKVSILIASLRKLILLIPLIIILPNFMDVDGVFLSSPIADIITIIVAIVSFSLYFKKLVNRHEIEYNNNTEEIQEINI